jgi:hypothetical protein
MLAVLLALLAGSVHRGLRCGLRDFLAAPQRLLAGLLGLLLDAAGRWTELLVLDARARHEQAREEADGDREAERVLLREAGRLADLARR